VNAVPDPSPADGTVDPVPHEPARASGDDQVIPAYPDDFDPALLLITAFSHLLAPKKLAPAQARILLDELLTAQRDGNHPLSTFLRPEWQRWLERMTRLTSPADAPPDGFDPRLVEWLGRLPAAQRQTILIELRAISTRLTDSAQPADNLDHLARQIEQAQNPPPPPIVPMVPPPAPKSAPVNKPATLHVATASPSMPITWAKARELPKWDAATLQASLAAAPLLFGPPGWESQPIALVRDAVPKCLWFVGDLHGDLLTLRNAWQFIEEQAFLEGERPCVVFLGDFVDRGPHSHEALLCLFDLVVSQAGRVGIVVGNHDDDLRWDEAQGTFCTTTDPAEYCDELNACIGRDDEESRFRVAVGKMACAFFRRCPRAIFLPDGLLLAHGGFPHTDLQGRISSTVDLQDANSLQDFVWLRTSASAPRKRPNRATRGCEFGYDDFAKFCACAGKLGIRVERFLRGHDHLPERYGLSPRQAPQPIVTLNTMCRRLEDEMMSERYPLPCIARHRPGELPLIYRLALPRGEVQAAYPSHPLSP
jgi:hypothetical protein